MTARDPGPTPLPVEAFNAALGWLDNDGNELADDAIVKFTDAAGRAFAHVTAGWLRALIAETTGTRFGECPDCGLDFQLHTPGELAVCDKVKTFAEESTGPTPREALAAPEHDITPLDMVWMRTELRTARDMLAGDYWLWQGDGEDHLESLVCPVVIRPDVLAALLSAPRSDLREKIVRLERVPGRDGVPNYCQIYNTALCDVLTTLDLHQRALSAPDAVGDSLPVRETEYRRLRAAYRSVQELSTEGAADTWVELDTFVRAALRRKP